MCLKSLYYPTVRLVNYQHDTFSSAYKRVPSTYECGGEFILHKSSVSLQCSTGPFDKFDISIYTDMTNGSLYEAYKVVAHEITFGPIRSIDFVGNWPPIKSFTIDKMQFDSAVLIMIDSQNYVISGFNPDRFIVRLNDTIYKFR